MIGLAVTGEDGKPLAQYKKLSPSSYQPEHEVMELFSRCQTDYQLAWRLQHRPFDEFDGVSLLQRAKADQQTFGAYVGASYVAEHKRWRWRGRKQTARNKLIGILAHMLAGMLYPLVNATNNEDEPDKMAARVMRIIIEEHLRKANYEMKFMYMVLSALVNPAVLVEVDYLIAYQRIKEQLANGKVKITEAVDNFLSGLNLNIIPIDQLLLGDFYTNEIQKQPFIVRVNRIAWDTAKKIYGHHPDFKYVEAGKTRIFLAGQEHLTLYDIEWTEGDRTAVQVITVYYRDEDLEATWVGGVFMGNTKDVYNTNPFKHRRFSQIEDDWKSIPIYPFAKSYYQPIDPAGRFAYGKSGAFLEYWDDASQNKMYQLLLDGTYLDVIKPLFLSGVAKTDSVVIAPGATVGMPPGSQVTPFALGPNLVGAMNALSKTEQDMSESTQDKIMSGNTDPGVTATQSLQAQNQARLQLGVFGTMIADLIKQVGELAMDCVIQHVTVGELDASVPDSLNLKYKTLLAKTKERGKDITNRVIFKSSLMGKKMTPAQLKAYEFNLHEMKGGDDQEVWHVNPYRFARTTYTFYIDPDQIINHAMGNDRQQKIAKAQMLSQPFVYPFVDQKALADEIIEEWSEGDPDRLKSKGQQGSVNDMMSAVMGGQQGQQGQQTQPQPKQGAMVGAQTAGINSMSL